MALLAVDRAADAEVVFRKDLEIDPDNGWSLLGLAQSLDAKGEAAESRRARTIRSSLGTRGYPDRRLALLGNRSDQVAPRAARGAEWECPRGPVKGSDRQFADLI